MAIQVAKAVPVLRLVHYLLGRMNDGTTEIPSLVFTAQGLTKTYTMGEVQVPALRGIDLELFEGEFVVLLGPSGRGKSTLLNILGGLDTASAGNVFNREHNLVTSTEAELTAF